MRSSEVKRTLSFSTGRPAARAASAAASLARKSSRSLRCMHGFFPMWLMGDQPNRSCIAKYEYIRAIGSRSVTKMRTRGLATWKSCAAAASRLSAGERACAWRGKGRST